MVPSMPDQESSRKIKSWSVPAECAAVRLDAFLRRCLPHLSRREVENAIEEKLLRINGRVGKKGDRLIAGDVLRFKGPASWLLESPPADAELKVPILYEDLSLLVVDKPAGMPTHGFSGRATGTLANFLTAQRPDIGDIGKSRWEPGLLHRLDRETSGLVLVAKTQAAFEDLRIQFRRRQIKKRYRALVWGITEAEGSIAYPLIHDPRDQRRMIAVMDAVPSEMRRRRWQALTRFQKRGDAEGLSLLEIEMETGVTHQIRVHLAAAGHPIVGDTLYGVGGADGLGLRRHFLHACGLEFFHPAGRTVVKVESELPAELRAVLEKLSLHY
jgi:23S rRNA pseudouridine1911/1915/1917 synthase